MSPSPFALTASSICALNSEAYFCLGSEADGVGEIRVIPVVQFLGHAREQPPMIPKSEVGFERYLKIKFFSFFRDILILYNIYLAGQKETSLIYQGIDLF